MHGPVVTAVAASPWGPVRVAARASGVVAVSLLSTREAFTEHLVRRGLAPVLATENAEAGPARDLAGRTCRAIARVLDGADAAVEEIPVDLADRPAWDRLVLGAVRAVPRGTVVSYGEVARRIGRPGAARAVGGAVGRNPVGILVPCHRVIAADGTLGGYGTAAFGGREVALGVKRALLALEGVSPG
jgi:methylated-DNA-[protein]-cysteine S-methyltransferase